MAQDKKLGPGQQFGQWILVGDEPLGRGGNGAVWKARNTAGDTVAIKFLHKNHVGTKRGERFRHEVQFMVAEKGRPGILPLIDFHLPDNLAPEDRPWFTTVLAAPFTRLQLAGVAKLPELIAGIEEVARTLSTLHGEKKSHRDIKPENLFEVDGHAVLGDWGLVDFPEKGSVTEPIEILGPLFYVAPEMMADAADVPGQPADVYSLAKTIWVLASGQRYPLPGHQLMDDRAMRLSTYCPHPRAHHVDALIERCTGTDPADRPSMLSVADELAAWQKTPQPEALKLDIEALAKEYSAVFDVGSREEKKRKKMLQDAQGLLSVFSSMFEQTARNMATATNIPPREGEAYDLPANFGWTATLGGPRVLWSGNNALEVSQGETHHVRLQCFLQVELLSNQSVRIVAGHLVRYQAGRDQTTIAMTPIGCLEATAPLGSAQLENELHVIHVGFLKSMPDAIRAFAEQLKAVQR